MALTLVTGGASSGKSSYALSLFQLQEPVVFIATGIPTDIEMENRIILHKQQRPRHWKTIEVPTDLYNTIKKLLPSGNSILIDCVTFWISNLIILKKLTHNQICDRAEKLGKMLSRIDSRVVIVTNEVGMGIVPAEEISRDFRRTAGEVNQIFARHASTVYIVISGIGVKIK